MQSSRDKLVWLVCLSTLLGAGCHDHRKATVAAQEPHPTNVTRKVAPIAVDPSLPMVAESLGTPVRSARTWAMALAPNARGGWNFITQSYELNTNVPSEFVVLDLEAGTSKIFEASTHVYTIHRYQIDNQLRARNGRIFFPESDVSLAYYDPATESVKELGRLGDATSGDRIIFDGAFGPDGKLYLGTQSDKLPTIFQIDPDTLAVKRLGQVGQHRTGYSYAYSLAVDPPWIYVAVGESPWELAALNITTGESRILTTVTDQPWMGVEARAGGVAAALITGLHTPQQRKEWVWCIDGKTVALQGSKAPGSVHTVMPIAGTLASHPTVDLTSVTPDTDGVGRVRWRPRANGDWSEARYQVHYTSPVPLESITAMPDGNVLGSAIQYHGYFRYDPKAQASQYFGPHGPSRPVSALLNGKLYIAGYPNGVLYEYSPTAPWTAAGMDEAHVPTANPRWLGQFNASGAKYISNSVAWGSRLYIAGRRERDGVGGSLGYFDTTTNTFAGHHHDLTSYDPAGLVVVDPLQHLVLSTTLHPEPEPHDKVPVEARLIVFDRELAELERLQVLPGMATTGALFATPGSAVVIGFVRDQRALYRYDLAAKSVLTLKPLDPSFGVLGAVTQRDDGSIWIVTEAGLIRIDPTTLDTVTLGPPGTVPMDVTQIVWQGQDLYFIYRDELRRVARVGVR